MKEEQQQRAEWLKGRIENAYSEVAAMPSFLPEEVLDLFFKQRLLTIVEEFFKEFEIDVQGNKLAFYENCAEELDGLYKESVMLGIELDWVSEVRRIENAAKAAPQTEVVAGGASDASPELVVGKADASSAAALMQEVLMSELLLSRKANRKFQSWGA